MADGHFPTLVSKDRDVNSASNVIFTSVSDGTDTLLVNGDGSINVNVSGGAANSQFAEDSAHVSGDIGTEMLAVRRDSPVSGASADGDYATLNVDADGRLYTTIHDGGNSITVDGTVAVSNPGLTDAELRATPVPVSGTVAATQSGTWNIGTLTTITNPVAITDNSGSLTVDATDLDIRDLTLATDAVRVSGNATANSQVNPIYVQNVINAITGEVHDYNTVSAVASDASSNHDYTVATNMKLTQVTVAFSGGGRFEIQAGPVASLATVKVGFIPKEGGVSEVHFNPPLEVPSTSTGTIRVIRTNRQGQAQDVYSTIEGIDN